MNTLKVLKIILEYSLRNFKRLGILKALPGIFSKSFLYELLSMILEGIQNTALTEKQRLTNKFIQAAIYEQCETQNLKKGRKLILCSSMLHLFIF